MGRIADELQLAGHNVIVLQAAINLKCQDVGSKHAKVIVVKEHQNTIEAMKDYASEEFWNQMWTAPLYSPMQILRLIPPLTKMFTAGCENVLNQKDLMKQLKEEKFDLGITELFDFSAVPIFYEIDVKNVVGVSSLGMMEVMTHASGLPFDVSYIPGSLSVAGDDGSLWSRALNLVFTYCSYKFQNDLATAAQKIMDERYPGGPKVLDFVGNVSILFTNSDPLLEFPRPTLYKIVDLGGIGLREAEPLPEYFDKILSLREKTVFMSFGSLAPSSTMPSEMKKNIVKVFKKFPDVTFIWKYEKPDDGIAQGAENVYLTKWALQNDLLADQRLSLFMTHGGAASTYEGAARGVPLALFPLFADQTRNARMAERSGFGFMCSKHDLLDEAKLEQIIQRGLYDTGLHAKARNVSRLLKKKPFKPKELLIKYIDLALELGPNALLSPQGRKWNFLVLYNIDLLLIILLVLVVLVFFIYYIIQKILRFLYRVFMIKIKTE